MARKQYSCQITSDKPLSKAEREFCKLLVSGEHVQTSFRACFPDVDLDKLKWKAPLLARRGDIQAECKRLRHLSPKERLLERTQALIDGGSLRPEKELEAIELVNRLMTELSTEQETVETPEELDQFMASVVHKKAVTFR